MGHKKEAARPVYGLCCSGAAVGLVGLSGCHGSDDRCAEQSQRRIGAVALSVQIAPQRSAASTLEDVFKISVSCRSELELAGSKRNSRGFLSRAGCIVHRASTHDTNSPCSCGRTCLLPGCQPPSVSQSAPRSSGGRRGPPEAPCAAPQCGKGAPALLVSISTDYPIKYG